MRSSASSSAVRTSCRSGLDSNDVLDPATQPTVLYRNDSVWRLYAYPGGMVKAVGHRPRPGYGTVTVVCVYGPAQWVNSEEANQLILSVVPY